MNRHNGIRFLAGFMGIYHILMGALGIVSGSTAAWGARVLWHANVTVDPQFTYLAKFLGAYVVAFGVMMLFIAKDPVRYGSLVYPAVVVAVLRIAERLIFAGELKTAFGIGMERTIGTIAVVGALNLGLLLLKPRETYMSSR
ncbi:MAG TPA: hypothetical protein VFE61_20170 [Candidatus Sulfotelmatobacter sp.]|nr:hypothetical protein [Candidatus Sulfotelmatobacter sp.]